MHLMWSASSCNFENTFSVFESQKPEPQNRCFNAFGSLDFGEKNEVKGQKESNF